MDFSSIKMFDDEGKAITFDVLLRDIYVTSKKKKLSIDDIVAKLIVNVKNATDAAMLGPVIAEYVEVGIKNDDQLVKLAQIVQRATMKATSTSGEEMGLSEEEVLELKQVAYDMVDSMQNQAK